MNNHYIPTRYAVNVIISRIINAVSFYMLLLLLYPITQINPAYNLLSFCAAIGMLWLTSRITKDEERYRSTLIYVHILVLVALIAIGLVLGYSKANIFVGALIFAAVGIIDGGFRLYMRRRRAQAEQRRQL